MLDRVLDAVAGQITALPGGCFLVGVDGVDGAGKTTFADALARTLRRTGRTAARVSLDDFHRPRAVRYARGRDSPEGFFLDSFDLDRFVADVVRPIRAGQQRLRPIAHDLATDESIDPPWSVVDPGCIVIVDGLFLHRDELVPVWDLSVFLDVSFEITAARMALRDGTPADPADPAMRRYVEGQRLYLAACEPWRRASMVIDNSDVR
ncbi:hypothetical protein, partial [Jatrophihabitans endophyticus]|uniref:hypothetical protein n=1 Tax=Jatrophihabitans endophyticus TaxID=1206085 RepID=UPI0019F198F7